MKLEKLSKDESGKLQGGFITDSARNEEDALWNGNCSESSGILWNANCGDCGRKCGGKKEETNDKP